MEEQAKEAEKVADQAAGEKAAQLASRQAQEQVLNRPACHRSHLSCLPQAVSALL